MANARIFYLEINNATEESLTAALALMSGVMNAPDPQPVPQITPFRQGENNAPEPVATAETSLGVATPKRMGRPPKTPTAPAEESASPEQPVRVRDAEAYIKAQRMRREGIDPSHVMQMTGLDRPAALRFIGEFQSQLDDLNRRNGKAREDEA